MMDASKPPSGKRIKPRAPPPPQVPQPAPRRIFRGADSQDEESDRDMKENMLSETVELRLTLPTGFQTTLTEDGSKALMDVLVELSSRYHLNPSIHTLELFTPEGHPLGFKPNALLGSLNVACVLIKEKVLEERQMRRPAPKVPEKTVRLLVNYHGSQKAVVRVNPLLPLQDLVPVICDKCELDPALIVLLTGGISRQELPLDKSLSHLGIKELYVHDKSLDSLRSSTNSLARAEKKGLLGLFQFSRRKSKTETTSLDMEDYNDSEAHSNAISTMFGSPYVEERAHMSQSQSAMNISRMSPKAEARKKRAPAPPGSSTHSTEHLRYDANQMCLGSDTQQRKRKAPAPPPTPVSLSSGSENVSATATPVGQHIQAPSPVSRTKMAASTTLTTTTVVIEDIKPVAPKTVQSAVYITSQNLRSSTPSSTTSDSLGVQDSRSELTQSLEESDSASHCSTTTGSMVSGLVQVMSMAKSSISRTEKSESTTNISASDVSTASSSRSDTEAAMNLKMEETENNRHSGVGWLHSMQSSAAKGHCIEISPEETVSLGSNSSGISLPDQGYAASEGMADGEDSGLVSSPSETHTTSPDGSLSLDGSSGGERRTGTAADNFNDSDEGTWGSRHRSTDVTPHPRTHRLKQQDLSSQLHQTLADLESCLADSNEVPVSIVDHDVPVTTIDEVLPDEGFWAESNAANASSYNDELQNRNNNAHTASEPSKGHSAENKQISQHKQKSVQEPSKTHKKKDTTGTLETETNQIIKKTDTVFPNKVSSNSKEQQDNNKSDVKPEDKNIHQAAVNLEAIDLPRVQHTISTSKPFQSKITPSVSSRFGMKTFTVVPPKPAVLQAAAGEPASTTPGAIKIDEQGNMVKVFHHRAPGVSDLRNGHDSPFHGKAKAFWSSNEKQEDDVGPNKDHADKARDSLDSHKSARTKTSETTQKSTETASLKTSHGTFYKPTPQTEPKETIEDAAEQIKDIDTKQKDYTMPEDKILPSTNPTQRPVQPPSITDARRDLSFLKPSRRTSSQYVASAITKYAPKTAIKPDYNPTIQEYPIKTPKSSRSIQINPQNSFRSSNANSSSFTSDSSGSKRSISYPEQISYRQEDGTDEVKEQGVAEKNFQFGKGSFMIQETQKSSNNHSVSSTQLNTKFSEPFKPLQRRSPSPSPSRHQNSSGKAPTGLKNGHQEQALNNPVTTPTSNLPKTDETPFVTVTDTPGSPAVTVFGPVKKFRPVICKSVEKESSLHSSLMEAIQSGDGKEKLKKISTSGVNKKSSHAEEENERSALMAAIRAKGNSRGLRKTKSKAAGEVENFRKTTLDVNSSAQISSMPSSPHSVVRPPPAPTVAPPPSAPTIAPPPPPPVLTAPKSFTLSQANMNPAMTREAMLEAIRSGSAAEKLKKVAVPAKTVQVNGKLGTIKATSSTMT
ncbi:protein cordon-bleu isoform X2 [Eucyclogobius newberryi]|uniref:protein cordon-bleu isoform X2 n=1 Tax=Eucyclogobius newberryi TaxID=166745 RepID=UPI003B595B1E